MQMGYWVPHTTDLFRGGRSAEYDQVAHPQAEEIFYLGHTIPPTYLRHLVPDRTTLTLVALEIIRPLQ